MKRGNFSQTADHRKRGNRKLAIQCTVNLIGVENRVAPRFTVDGGSRRGPSPSGPESETNRDWRGAARSMCSRRKTTEKLSAMRFNDLAVARRNARFSRTTDAATGLWDSAEHRKRGPPPRQGNWVWKGRGRSVTGVSPRVVAKSKSVYPRSEASLRDGEKEEKDEEAK